MKLKLSLVVAVLVTGLMTSCGIPLNIIDDGYRNYSRPTSVYSSGYSGYSGYSQPTSTYNSSVYSQPPGVYIQPPTSIYNNGGYSNGYSRPLSGYNRPLSGYSNGYRCPPPTHCTEPPQRFIYAPTVDPYRYQSTNPYNYSSRPGYSTRPGHYPHCR